MTARLALVAFLIYPFALAAQTPCEDGQAGEFECDGIDLLAHLPKSEITDEPNLRGNDMWGWTDPETGNEYALIGLEDRTVFIDVSTPTDPEVIGTLHGECGFPQSWRDIKVYADHAFIVADGCNHGIQIFDLTRLRDVQNPPVTFDTDGHYTEIADSHNIVINEDAALAFPVGSSACTTGLEILDISDPLNPSHAGCWLDSGQGTTNYVHDAQCVRYDGPDEDYAGQDVCFNAHGGFCSGNNYMSIVDVTVPDSTQFISRVYYQPGPCYGHQGWLSDDQRYFFLDDELTESTGGTRTYVFDLEDLDNPEFVYYNQGTTEAGAHNLYVRGDFMYQSNYEAGLRIWDVGYPQNAASLNEVAYFDTYPPGDTAGSFDGTWSNYPFFESGIVVVNDRQYGVFILQPTSLPISNPQPSPSDELRVDVTGPNPANEQTAITIIPPTNQSIAVDLIDAEGRIIHTNGPRVFSAGWPSEISINVRELPTGTYFLRVKADQETVTKQITVVR